MFFIGIDVHKRQCQVCVLDEQWVARHLESLGFEVIVADPGKAT